MLYRFLEIESIFAEDWKYDWFAIYQVCYDYVTSFDDLTYCHYSDAFYMVDAFKRKKINTHIIEKITIIFKWFNILLGDIVTKRFTTSELIEKCRYPDVDYEKLVEFNKKNGVDFTA